jgi:hypothetical protein
LATNAPPVFSTSPANIGAGFDQPHRAQMIGLLVADRVGRHVRQDQIGLAAQFLGEDGGGGLVHEIHLQDGDASIGSVGSRSMPTMRRPALERRTTWLQPPGAMPRSITRFTPRSRVKRSSSSRNLYAARLR